MKYIIRHGKAFTPFYLAGINEEHQIAQLTLTKSKALQFDTVDDAELFINRYADAGYGIDSTKSGIRPYCPDRDEIIT